MIFGIEISYQTNFILTLNFGRLGLERLVKSINCGRFGLKPIIKSIFQINLDNGSEQSNLGARKSKFIDDNVSTLIRNARQRMLH